MHLTRQQRDAVGGGRDRSKSLSCSCSEEPVCGSAKTMQVDTSEVWRGSWWWIQLEGFWRTDHALIKGVDWWAAPCSCMMRCCVRDMPDCGCKSTSWWSGGGSDQVFLTGDQNYKLWLRTTKTVPVCQHCYHIIRQGRVKIKWMRISRCCDILFVHALREVMTAACYNRLEG